MFDNMSKLLTIAVVGAADGYVKENQPGSIDVLGQSMGNDTAINLGALLGGLGLQWLAPRTMPDIADGLFEAGLYGVARHLGIQFGGGQFLASGQSFPQLVSGPMSAPYAPVAPQFGGITGQPQFELT